MIKYNTFYLIPTQNQSNESQSFTLLPFFWYVKAYKSNA